LVANIPTTDVIAPELNIPATAANSKQRETATLFLLSGLYEFQLFLISTAISGTSPSKAKALRECSLLFTSEA
jgi:hypothetical protein